MQLELFKEAEPAVPYLLTINRFVDGEIVPIVTIRPDLTMEFADDYEPEEAAAIFWNSVRVRGEFLIDTIHAQESEIQELEILLNQLNRTFLKLSDSYILADAEREALRHENQRLRNPLGGE